MFIIYVYSILQILYLCALEIHRSRFEKFAYFDSFKIQDLGDIKIDSIRSIIRELRKYNNNIEIHKFKVLELEIHRKNKAVKWYDRRILDLHSFSSKYGTEPFRGILFTLGGSLFFYTITFLAQNYLYDVSLEGIESFVTTYFTFITPSFKNPFDTEMNMCSYFLFLVGKIFIGYGIYQTIQAFRKFKI